MGSLSPKARPIGRTPPGFRRLRIGASSILIRASDADEARIVCPTARIEGDWAE